MNHEKKPTLLIVDDEVSDILLMKDVVSELDVQCIAVDSGEEALKVVKGGEDISLIILDINMPKMNGFQLALKLRELPQCRETPIIFVSASSDDQSEIAAYEYGAIDYICKPISPYVFRCKVSLHIKLFHSYLGLHNAMNSLKHFKRILSQTNELTEDHSTDNVIRQKAALKAIHQKHQMMLDGVGKMHAHHQKMLENICFYKSWVDQKEA